MKLVFFSVGLCVCLVLDQTAVVAANTNNLLVGTWESQLIGPGRDRATCYLTFSNDFTWAGYGIALKSLGPVTIAGLWGVDSKDKITGSFTEYRDDGDISGTLTKFVAGRNEIRGHAFATQGRIRVKGVALSTTPGLSGSWSGEVHTRGNTSYQSYTFSTVANTPGWFNITGTGIGENGVYTIHGALVVTSDRQANGYLASDFGSVTTTSVWSFAGKFLPSLERATFRGHTDTGHRIVIRAAKQ